jgi:oligopeptide transport system substrate-binding protein
MKNTLLALLVLSVSLVGCQRQSSDSAAKSSTPVDEFHFNNGAEPESLDPHRSSTHDAAQLSNQLHETLITRANDYFTLRPGIAESWTVSKDGFTWTFKIRENMKWSNGEPMTIEQIRGSFFRAMEPQAANPYINWYSDFIAGADDYIKGIATADKDKLAANVGIRIKDPQTLEITLKKPVSFFGHLIAQPTFAIIHPEMYASGSPRWKSAEMIVSGPYQLKDWRVNQRIVMEKNPNYWDAENVSIPRLVSYPINDQQTTLNMFQSGQLDWTGENTLNSTIVPSLKERPDFHITQAFGTYMYVFNTKRKPFDDVRVRRALSLAINPVEVTDRISKSGVVPAYRLVPPGIPEYKEEVSLPRDMDARIAEAKKLLAEAGFEGGKGFPNVTLLYNTSEAHHRIAQAVQRMWQEALGIRVNLQNAEWKVAVKEMDAGNFDVTRYAWIGDYPDPSTFIDFLQSKSENNHGSFESSVVDESLKAANLEVDSAKRFKLLAKAESALVEEAAVAPIYHYVYYSLMSPRVEGFEANMFGHYSFKDFKKN